VMPSYVRKFQCRHAQLYWSSRRSYVQNQQEKTASCILIAAAAQQLRDLMMQSSKARVSCLTLRCASMSWGACVTHLATASTTQGSMTDVL
jgi:hypothetical protein